MKLKNKFIAGNGGRRVEIWMQTTGRPNRGRPTGPADPGFLKRGSIIDLQAKKKEGVQEGVQL